MPLRKGTSQPVVSSNIKTLVDDWKKDGSIGTSHPTTKKKAVQQVVRIVGALAIPGSRYSNLGLQMKDWASPTRSTVLAQFTAIKTNALMVARFQELAGQIIGCAASRPIFIFSDSSARYGE